METHLLSDIAAEGCPGTIPLHLFLDQDSLSASEFRALCSLRFLGVGERRWVDVPFRKIDREFRLGSLLTEKRRVYGDGRSVDCVTVGGGKVCRFGLVCSVDVPADRVSGGAVLRLRTIFGETVTRSAGFRDIDLLGVDVFRRRVRFSADADDAAADRRTGGGEEGRGVSSRRFASTDEDDVLATAERAVADRGGFFEVETARKMSVELESYLSRFSESVVRTNSGPLEPPSRIRGKRIRERRGDLLVSPEAPLEDAAESFRRTRSDRWFGDENEIHVTWVPDTRRERSVGVIWYSESCATSISTPRHPKVDAALLREAVVGEMERVSDFLLSCCRIVSWELEASARNQGLRRRFACAIDEEVDQRLLVELLWISRSVWVSNVDGDSCIIKAMVRRSRRETRGVARLVGACPSGADDEVWADVIDCHSGIVYAGREVSLRVDRVTGSLRSCFRDGERTGWEADPRLCVFYLGSDLSAIWSIPGGFALAFRLKLDGVDGLVLERFKERPFVLGKGDDLAVSPTRFPIP